MDKAYFYAMLCCYIFSLVVNIMRYNWPEQIPKFKRQGCLSPQ